MRSENPLKSAVAFEAGQDMSADHRLVISAGGETHTIILHSVVSGGRATFVGLGPLGEAVFVCRSAPKQMVCDKIAEGIPAEQLSEVVQLALAPLAGIEKNMSDGFFIHQGLNKRMITYEGRIWGDILYDRNDPWSSRIQINAVSVGYRLELIPLREMGHDK